MNLQYDLLHCQLAVFVRILVESFTLLGALEKEQVNVNVFNESLRELMVFVLEATKYI